MPTYQAIQMARERGLDLVEVAAQAVPPVCRVLDYGKFKFEQEKKERQARKGQRSGELRELRIRPKINEHDLTAKSGMVKRLLDEGDKVRVSVVFRGREITHPELGWKLLQKLSQTMKDVALVEKLPAMEGNMLTVIFAPGKKAPEKAERLPEAKPAAKPAKEAPRQEAAKETAKEV